MTLNDLKEEAKKLVALLEDPIKQAASSVNLFHL